MAYTNLLSKILSQREGLRDYDHASRTFVSNNLGLHPKYSFLFHVFIQLNPALIDTSVLDANHVVELSLMVKTVDLPNFTIDAKTLNSYNRPNVVQNKIKYEPVSISFHDDNSNVVRDFWADYYSYYYKDITHSDQAFHQPFKYEEQQMSEWGFSPRVTSAELAKERYIKSIRIFSFHGGRFSEYRMFNPIITNWKHGKHNQSEGSALLENTMTFQYEGMKYNSGRIISEDGAITDEMLAVGFTTLKYDTDPSPFRIKRLNGGVIATPISDPNVLGLGRPILPSINSLNLPFINMNISGALSIGTALRSVQRSDARIMVPTSIGGSASIQAGPVNISTIFRKI